jgi:N-acetylmuramoyl-L-alanine amidase
MAKIYLSPSDQRSNFYAYGNTSEDVQCGKIAAACKAALERSGVEVMVGQYDTMANRCRASNAFGADIHCPIHTNAFDGKVMGTRIFAYDTKGKGWQYANKVFDVLAPVTPGKSENVKAAPQLYEVKTPAAPTVYIECEFHDSIAGASWIIENTELIGEKIAEGLCNALGVTFVGNVVDGDYVPYAEYEAYRAATEKLIFDMEEAVARFKQSVK